MLPASIYFIGTVVLTSLFFCMSQLAVRHNIRYEDQIPIGYMCRPKYGYAPETEGKWCSAYGLPLAEAKNWGNCAKFQSCANDPNELYVLCCEARTEEIMENCYNTTTGGRTSEWRPLTGPIPDCGGMYNAGQAELSDAVYEAGLGYIGQWKSLGGTAKFALHGCSNRNTYNATVTYSLKSGNRGLSIWVNGEVQVPELLFPVTGGWQKYQTVKTELSFDKGLNELMFMSIGKGGPNLKRIKIDAPLVDRLIDVPDWMDENCNDEDRYVLNRYEACSVSTEKNCWLY
eukprot:g3724.t1